MADFSRERLSGPQGSPVTPIQPAQEPSAIAAGLDFLSNIVPSRGEMQAAQQAEQEFEQNTFVGEFVSKQMKVADAVAQGSISSAEGRSRMRANLASSLAENPALYDDLVDAQKSVTTTSGVGKVAAEGTEKEQQAIKFRNAAYDDGWIKPGMSPQEEAVATEKYRSFQFEQSNIDAEENRLALEEAQARASMRPTRERMAQLDLIQKERTETSRRNVTKLADSYNYKFRNDLKEIRTRFESGELDEKEALQLVEGQWSTIQSVVNSVGMDAGSAYLGNVIKPMENVYKFTKEVVSGKIDKENYINKVNQAVAQQKLMLLNSDPQMAQIVATSQLLPNTDLTTFTLVNSKVVEILGKNGQEGGKVANPSSGSAEEQQDNKNYFNLLKNGISNSEDTPEAKQEIRNNLVNVLRGVDAYSGTVDSASEYNELVDFLSSPEFGQYISQAGGVPSEVAGQAKNILQEQYEQEVLPLIVEEYDKANVLTGVSFSRPGGAPTGEESPATSLISPVFTGGGVSFKVVNSEDSLVKRKARELNKKVAPVLNRLIRTSAHLAGNTNYEKTFNENYVGLFGTEQETNNEE